VPHHLFSVQNTHHWWGMCVCGHTHTHLLRLHGPHREHMHGAAPPRHMWALTRLGLCAHRRHSPGRHTLVPRAAAGAYARAPDPARHGKSQQENCLG
jgi:hypothetical protein